MCVIRNLERGDFRPLLLSHLSKSLQARRPGGFLIFWDQGDGENPRGVDDSFHGVKLIKARPGWERSLVLRFIPTEEAVMEKVVSIFGSRKSDE